MNSALNVDKHEVPAYSEPGSTTRGRRGSLPSTSAKIRNKLNPLSDSVSHIFCHFLTDGWKERYSHGNECGPGHMLTVILCTSHSDRRSLWVWPRRCFSQSGLKHSFRSDCLKNMASMLLRPQIDFSPGTAESWQGLGMDTALSLSFQSPSAKPFHAASLISTPSNLKQTRLARSPAHDRRNTHDREESKSQLSTLSLGSMVRMRCGVFAEVCLTFDLTGLSHLTEQLVIHTYGEQSHC
ncbi:hypothetical protein F7725_010307 [Dissostichus mawsoni]|uniref:Uncharacterized protein n=1 Tax=Dissostichus mawsoni TaxID=36200 RepID=A0A7J5XPQ1_DISMA|nr:hypothetical protein F7725_010307 [Dissostichus mawsoni]